MNSFNKNTIINMVIKMEKTDNKQVVNKKEIVKKLLKQEISADDESDLIEMLIEKTVWRVSCTR